MAISTKRVLRMTFNNAAGSAVTITLPQPVNDNIKVYHLKAF